jgi:hypothetical protein
VRDPDSNEKVRLEDAAAEVRQLLMPLAMETVSCAALGTGIYDPEKKLKHAIALVELLVDELCHSVPIGAFCVLPAGSAAGLPPEMRDLPALTEVVRQAAIPVLKLARPPERSGPGQSADLFSFRDRLITEAMDACQKYELDESRNEATADRGGRESAASIVANVLKELDETRRKYIDRANQLGVSFDLSKMPSLELGEKRIAEIYRKMRK